MPIVSIIEENGQISKYELPSGEVLFDGLQDAGLELPHGCLSGSCSACKCEITEGYENLSQASLVEENTLKSVYKNKTHAAGKRIRLACRAKVLGDLCLKPFK